MNRKHCLFLLISVSYHVVLLAQNRCDQRGCSSKPEDLKNRGSSTEKDFDDNYKEPKEDPGGGESYNRQPATGNGESKPTHNFRDDHKSVRGTNNPRSAIITDYDSHKPGGSGVYNSKPDSDEGRGGGESYNRKPSGGSDESKPLATHSLRDDHKPVRGISSSRPATNTGYDVYSTKPVRGSDENIPLPAHSFRDDPKPVRGLNNPRPAINTDYDTYNPKPKDRESGYDASHKPYMDDTIPKPVSESDYRLKPISESSYQHKPVAESDYRPKPVAESGYRPKPVSESDYRPKPISESGYRPKPVAESDYRPKPVEESGYRPKPYINRPSPERDYIRKDDISRPGEPVFPNKDLGGYYKPKDEDYSDDFDRGTGDGKAIPLKEADCICVPYYQCKDGHIVTDGAGIIDARKRPEPDEELPLDGKFKPPSCGPFHVCCNTPETSTVKPYEHRCGVRNPSGINSRILSPSNKGEADFGEWPWQAAVLKSEGKVNIFQCGGVLIDKFHVLTVAHCVFHLYKYDEYPLKVRLGEWDTQTTSEFLAHEDYRVSKIIVHPEYRNTSLWNDVAILRLEEAVLFAPHVDTICLPKYDEIFADQICVVTGWGKDAYKGGTFSNIMKEVALQVIDDYKCEEMLRKTRLGRFFQLHEGFLCAGGELGLDSCKGDGGGPLVCYRKNKSYALAGIVSWGIDCGQPGVPGVYVKIQKYLEWISKSTGTELQEYWPKS